MMPLRPVLLASLLFVSLGIFAQSSASVGNLPARVSQGAMVIGQAPPDSEVRVAGRRLRVDADGRFVFGVGRDEQGPVAVSIQPTGGKAQIASIAITPRDWPIQRINGVPPATVNPPPQLSLIHI